MRLNEENIQHIITLLDDPDEEVFKSIFPIILENIEDFLPFIIRILNESKNQVLTKHTGDICSLVHLKVVEDSFVDYTKNLNPEPSLLEGLLLIERLSCADFDENGFRKYIQELSQKVWLVLNDEQTGIEIATKIQKVFTSEKIYTNTKSTNVFLNDCCKSTGKTLSYLYLLYLIVCQQNNVPIRPIKIANHGDEAKLCIGYVNAQTARLSNINSQHGVVFAIDNKMKICANKEVLSSKPLPYYHYLLAWQINRLEIMKRNIAIYPKSTVEANLHILAILKKYIK